MKPKIYIASPLFSQAEKAFNIKIRESLKLYFDTYLPQEDGGLVAEMVDKKVDPVKAKEMIFAWDIQAIEKSDVLLAVLDGRTIDEGVAFEIGYAYKLEKPCVGFQTDPRRLLPFGNNAMIDCALEVTFHNLKDLEDWAKFFRKRTS